MKNKLSGIVAVIVSVSFFTFSCTSQEQKIENSKEDIEDASEELKEANEEYDKAVSSYKLQIQLKIDENIAKINEYKSKTVSGSKETKAKYLKRIEVLEARNMALKQRMDNYVESGKDNWEKFKNEFNRDIDELDQSLKAFPDNEAE